MGQATPAAPAWSRKTPTALPATLSKFMAIETYIVVRVFPMLRYSAAPAFTKAAMDKIMGRGTFKGVSPIDPYCGKDYLKF